MRKKILLFGFAAAMTATCLTSCTKEANEKTATVSQNGKPVKVGKQVKEILKFFNFSVEIIWSNGCLQTETVEWLGGLLYTKTTESCKPGCPKCKVSGTGKVGINLTTSPEGNRGLEVADLTNVNDLHSGMIAFTEDRSTIIFAVDITKMHSNCVAEFEQDQLNLPSPFLINGDVASALGLTSDQQIVPAGSYELKRDGNIVWWSMPVTSLTGIE